MFDEIDRDFKKQVEPERLARGGSVAAELARLTERDDALRRLRDQAVGASAMFGTSAGMEALDLTRSGSIASALAGSRLREIAGIPDIARREYELGSLRNTAMQLSSLFANGVPGIDQQFDLAKLANDIKVSLAASYPKIDIPAISGIHQAAEQFNQMFRVPDFQETIGLAQSAVTAVSMSRSALQNVMDQIDGPWLRTGSELASASALGNLTAIHRAINGARPFGEAATKLLRDQLGDWRRPPSFPEDIFDPISRSAYYVDRGYDRSLTDFPAQVVDEILTIVEGEEDEGGETRSDQSYHRLSRFERRLRNFIEKQLRSVVGNGWERSRVPPDVLQDWEEKRQAAIDSGAEPHPRLIDYADFRHYEKIISRRDNWREVFSAMFRRKSDIEESLLRLAPVRLITMHAGLVTVDDAMLVEVETKRVLNVIARS